MNRKEYLIPATCCMNMQPSGLLSASAEELPFDPNDETYESLTKGQGRYSVWDDDWSETDTH